MKLLFMKPLIMRAEPFRRYERINERYDMPYSCLQGILLELELKGLAGSEGTRFRLKPGGL